MVRDNKVEDRTCPECVFSSGTETECVFSFGKIKKPSQIKTQHDCGIFLRKSYYDRSPEEYTREIVERAEKIAYAKYKEENHG